MKNIFIYLITFLLLAACFQEQDNPLIDSARIIKATCNDGILNQDEEDIDCGGVCKICRPENCSEQLESNSLIIDGERYTFQDLYVRHYFIQSDYVIAATKSNGKNNFKLSIRFEGYLPYNSKKYDITENFQGEESTAYMELIGDEFSNDYYAYSGKVYIEKTDNYYIIEFCDVKLKNEYNNEINASGKLIHD
ncbi:hypothetical protein [Fulvivirga sediminis]|uniref:Lipoprotein n=1 Tax=Fulvivirga sediminis TaxID=2803949 RepID=A0A937K1U5_9BACT|nr:hypothetical protein [Fulvivirga sediminis]MBL3657866.1 hypothetical protein [Fulvivirga sediminis]